MPISALDVRTVKLITTTQIITSVYAVVKELIENAIDADADNIEINLVCNTQYDIITFLYGIFLRKSFIFMHFFSSLQVDNGTSLIEVKDNGHGISKEDAPYMGLPSYTSKISNFEDLGSACIFNLQYFSWLF